MNTYTLLAEAVARWLNRENFSSLTDEVENLIAMGQRRIHRECDLKAMEEVDGAFSIASQTEDVPTDLLRVKALTILSGGYNTEVKGSPHKMVMKYGYQSVPRHYSIVKDQFHFGPPPSSEYTAQLVYYKPLEIVSESVESNWITENIPELLLHATMLEACMFLKDDNRMQVWGARYDDTKETLLLSESRQDKESGSLQVREA